jgi:hypothetical protein
MSAETVSFGYGSALAILTGIALGNAVLLYEPAIPEWFTSHLPAPLGETQYKFKEPKPELVDCDMLYDENDSPGLSYFGPFECIPEPPVDCPPAPAAFTDKHTLLASEILKFAAPKRTC